MGGLHAECEQFSSLEVLLLEGYAGLSLSEEFG